MAEIEREVSMKMRGADIRARGMLFTCFVGKCPDGGTVLVIPDWDACVTYLATGNIQHNSDKILTALIKAADSNTLPTMDICFDIAKEIAEAIEPYLNGGEENG